MADLIFNIVKAPVGWVVHLDRVRITARKGRRSRPRWSQRPSLFEMAKVSMSAYRATRSCAMSNHPNGGQRNGSPF